MANIQTLLGTDKLKEAYPKVNASQQAINNELASQQGQITSNNNARINQIMAHINSLVAHASQNITYSGSIPSQTNVKSALDAVYNYVNTIITTPIDGAATTAEIVAARTSLEKAKVFATLGLRLEEIEVAIHKTSMSAPITTYANVLSLPSTTIPNGQVSVGLKGQTAKNEVVNGNFANGTTGWAGSGATISALNNTLSITASGVNASPRAFQNSPVVCQSGKKVFLKFKARVTNANAQTLRMFIGGTTGGAVNVMQLLSPVQNQWYSQSVILTLDSSFIGNLIISPQHTYIDSTTANGKVMEIQEAFAIDMGVSGTELFALTADQMNTRFPNFFDGTKSTFTGGGRAKADNKNIVNLFKAIPLTSEFASSTATINIVQNQITATIPAINNGFGQLSMRVVKQSYTLSYKTKGSDNYRLSLRLRDANKNIIPNTTAITGFSQATSDRYTIAAITNNTIIDLSVISNVAYIDYCIQNSANANPVVLDELMIRPTSATITYEPYQNLGEAYINETLRSVPSAKDEIRASQSGGLEKVQRVKEKILQSSDITSLVTTNLNIDIARITRPTDHIHNGIGATTIGSTTLQGYSEKSIITNDDISNIGYFTLRQSTGFVDVYVAKGTYANLAAAQTALTGTTLNYQLANPIITELQGIERLFATPNGTMYIDFAVKQTSIHKEGIYLNNPVKWLESVKLTDGTNITNVDLTNVTIRRRLGVSTALADTTATTIKATAHGLIVGSRIRNTTRNNAIRTVLTVPDTNTVTVATITGMTVGDTIERYTITPTDTTLPAIINITGATSSQVYETTYEYPSELSTQPEVTYSYPINLNAVVYANGQMLNSLSKESASFRAFTLASLWDVQNRLSAGGL